MTFVRTLSPMPPSSIATPNAVLAIPAMGKKSKRKPTGRNAKSGGSAPGAAEQVEYPAQRLVQRIQTWRSYNSQRSCYEQIQWIARHCFVTSNVSQLSSLPNYPEFDLKKRGYEPDTSDYLKRLGSNACAKWEWYFGAPAAGSIFPHRTVHPYTDTIRHSFSNQAYRKEHLFQGTMHVAVGFVDLGILFAAVLSDPPPSKCDGPLHFLGIDMSAYAVAKTQVVWELLKQTPSGPL